LVASQTWLPAISMPARLTVAGLRAVLEFVAQPHAEPQLFRLAFAFEQVTKFRQPPSLPA
jgi:Asp-tRNA(Asn)/Glu-tRNA(Gln) amidotransferase A subunit family amidase